MAPHVVCRRAHDDRARRSDRPRWRELPLDLFDAGWARVNSRHGDAKTFVANEAAAAKAEGLGLIVGANFLEAAGGNTAAMTASQIKQIGTALAKGASAGAAVGLKYARRLPQPERHPSRGARFGRREVAKSRTAASCVVN